MDPSLPSGIEKLLIRTLGPAPIKTWLFRMQKYLEALELTEVLYQGTPSDPQDFIKKDKIAQHILISHLTNESLNDIEHAKTAKEIWDIIYERYHHFVPTEAGQKVRMF